MKLLTMGLLGIQPYDPINAEAVLSIAFADGSCQATLSVDWAHGKRVYFDDCTLDRTGLPGSTTDITAHQARDIVRWVHDLTAADVQRLVIHCFAGVSRSTSIACALRDAYGWPYAQNPDGPAINQPVYLAVLAAATAAPIPLE